MIISPCSTKSGTCTTAPVSSVAGFVAPVAVFPLTPGSDSVIRSTTVRGGSIVGDHDIIFAGFGEIIELSHKALSRDVFAAEGAD